MSLLAPLFLLGLLGIALPVWLHRLNTRNPQRQAFSSTMLLEQSTQQTHVRKQLRYLLLLSLRILFLILMILAFSKPLITRPPIIAGGEGATLHYIVMDTSMSMNYGERFEGLMSAAGEIIDGMAGGDLAQIISVSNTIDIITDPTPLHNELLAAVDGLTPGNGRLELGAVVAGLDRLVEDGGQRSVVHLLSDFQQSGLPPRFADLIPGTLNDNLVDLILYPVSEPDRANLYIERIFQSESGVEVLVRGDNDATIAATVELELNGVVLATQTVDVAADGVGEFSFNSIAFEPGENRVLARLLTPDPLPADNQRSAVMDNTPPRPVLLISADIESLPVKYLTAAVESGQQDYRVEPVAAARLDPRILSRYPWVIIDDLGAINPATATALGTYLEGGGAVLASLGERAAAAMTIPVLGAGVRSARLASASFEPFVVASIDSSHPALAQTSGWRDISISRYISVSAGDDTRSLVSLDNGEPLILERRFQEGRLLVLTSKLDNRQSDLPVRPVFVNFIAEAGKYLSGDRELAQHQTAGDYLQLLQTGSAAGQVIAPDGRNLLSLADTHRSQDIKLNQTGFYQIYTTDGESLVAVNTDLRESRLSIMSGEQLQAWRDAIDVPRNSMGAGGVLNVEQDAIEIWHVLLLLMGIVVVTESLVANRYLGRGREIT